MIDYEKYIGIPYVEDGRDPAVGLDCKGLLLVLLKDLGIDLPDICSESDWAKCGRNLFVEKYHENTFEIEQSDLEPGDLIMVRGRSGVGDHVAVCVGDGQFIHSVFGVGVVKGRLSEKSVQRRMLGCYRVRT